MPKPKFPISQAFPSIYSKVTVAAHKSGGFQPGTLVDLGQRKHSAFSTQHSAFSQRDIGNSPEVLESSTASLKSRTVEMVEKARNFLPRICANQRECGIVRNAADFLKNHHPFMLCSQNASTRLRGRSLKRCETRTHSAGPGYLPIALWLSPGTAHFWGSFRSYGRRGSAVTR